MSRRFVDGVMDVVVLGGVARIEFFELKPKPGTQRAGGEQPDLVPEQTLSLAMPVEAFLRAVATLEKVRDEMSESARNSGPNRPRGGSPNFKLDN